jgi:uncharacterized oxidoreductase
LSLKSSNTLEKYRHFYISQKVENSHITHSEKTMDIQGKLALVTGGSDGIGRDMTLQLVEKGARVLVVGRDDARGKAICASSPHMITFLKADLSEFEEQQRLVREVTESHPDLSILINNAGSQVNLPEICTGDAGLSAQLQAEISVNLLAPVTLSFGLMPLLARQRSATIVNISSGLALAPMRSAPVYSATKAGLSMFSRGLRYRCEDAAPSIRVMDVIIPTVDTQMSRDRTIAKMSPSEAAKAVIAGIAKDQDQVWVARAKLLRILYRLNPRLVYRMLRNG